MNIISSFLRAHKKHSKTSLRNYPFCDTNFPLALPILPVRFVDREELSPGESAAHEKNVGEQLAFHQFHEEKISA